EVTIQGDELDLITQASIQVHIKPGGSKTFPVKILNQDRHRATLQLPTGINVPGKAGISANSRRLYRARSNSIDFELTSEGMQLTPPAILGFPDHAAIRQHVFIVASLPDPRKSKVNVTINGARAQVTSVGWLPSWLRKQYGIAPQANAYKIKLVTPANAQAGPIVLTTYGMEARSARNLKVFGPPRINSIKHEHGLIYIFGSDFVPSSPSGEGTLIYFYCGDVSHGFERPPQYLAENEIRVLPSAISVSCRVRVHTTVGGKSFESDLSTPVVIPRQ
ncbi:MAG: hypothetical protein Q9M27_05005, partial [Mariprofundaceae bacterium]|nr:hypothetical protein [Mariprofundaceae bacterium]